MHGKTQIEKQNIFIIITMNYETMSGVSEFEREGKYIRILFEVSLAYEDRILFTILARQIQLL